MNHSHKREPLCLNSGSSYDHGGFSSGRDTIVIAILIVVRKPSATVSFAIDSMSPVVSGAGKYCKIFDPMSINFSQKSSFLTSYLVKVLKLTCKLVLSLSA